MNPAEIRKRGDSFNPMKAERWTVWQALAWAVYRDVDLVRECSWIWLEKGPPCPVEGASLGPFRKIWEDMHTNDAVAEGWAKLWRALESGRVTSSGIDEANIRREIASLEWLDLEYCLPQTIEEGGYKPVRDDGPQCYRAGTDYTKRPEPAFRDVRVPIADVLKEFPEKRSAPKVGGRPPAADWPAIEEALNEEIDAAGLPRRDGVPGWRTTADIVKWVAARTDGDEPGKSALKDNVAKMLKRAEERKAGN
jgi:hypothetical protein